jgi:Flagellar hook-length control protein FliK
MALTVNPTLPVTPAQGAGSVTTGPVLQPGTVVSAQVQQILADDLVRIAIANLSIDVLTEIPLQAGQHLQLAVSQTANGLRLAVVGQSATSVDSGVPANAPANAAASPAATTVPANDKLTPLERIAVSIAAETAVTEQGSQAPLFANLATVVTSGTLPPVLRQAMAQVLAQQTPLDENLTGDDIRNAVQKSGVFLEASLAAGSAAPTAGVPDLKAALIVLRQALASSLGTGEDPVPAQGTPIIPTEAKTPSPPLVPSLHADAPEAPLQPSQPASQPTNQPIAAEADAHQVASQAAQPIAEEAETVAAGHLVLPNALAQAAPKSLTAAAVVSLPQEAQQEIPRAAGNAAAVTLLLPDDNGETPMARGNPLPSPPSPSSPPPPPFRGGLPSAQPVELPSLAPNASLSTTAHRLLDNTDAAIARQTLLQVASLPDRVDAPNSNLDPRALSWNFEIPFATPQGTAMAQFEISRDGGGTEAGAAKRVWRARFSLDVEPAGPVHALISFSGERTSVRMWAERPATAAQLRAGAGELSAALSRAELVPGEIVIRDGAPPQPAPPKAGHFLDRAL